MNNPFKATKNFINRYKKEEWFRAVAIIIIVTALTVVGVSYKSYREEKENPPEQSETEQAEESLIENIWNDSKLHLAVFVSLSAALLAVEHNKNRLKQTGGKEEE
ncbi:MAG: hypothetical protein PUH30_03310 [Oscillospiraceae bacterium]|nr:hypothetical protein [Oscillospiraceae bacterium]MDD7278544.1 hypothetical protein [Oscillospiraceae bacterium]